MQSRGHMNSYLHARLLTKAERKQVFKQHMIHDFPKNELRPLHMIEALVEKGNYYTYGIFRNEMLCAYAYFWEETEKQILLFDYFAVVSSMRNQGYGTKAMEVILDACKEKAGVILEVENPARAEDEQERKVRYRRISFYEKRGLQMSKVRIYLFGVEYCMMYRSLSGENIQAEIVSVMESLYSNTLPKPIYEKMFKVL